VAMRERDADNAAETIGNLERLFDRLIDTTMNRV
jgi:hypothetical protein